MTIKGKGPETGGGGHAIRASIVGNGTVELSIDDGAMARGREVMERVRDEIRHLPEPHAVRELGRWAKDFAHIVLRMPEFHEAMDGLRRREEDSVIRRILGEARRGRRYESYFYLVMVVNQVIEEEGCSAARAAAIVQKRYGREFGHKTARAIENAYSIHKEAYRLFRNCTFVTSEELTRDDWES